MEVKKETSNTQGQGEQDGKMITGWRLSGRALIQLCPWGTHLCRWSCESFRAGTSTGCLFLHTQVTVDHAPLPLQPDEPQRQSSDDMLRDIFQLGHHHEAPKSKSPFPLLDGLPPKLQALICRCLSYDPRARPSALDFIDSMLLAINHTDAVMCRSLWPVCVMLSYYSIRSGGCAVVRN